MIGIIGRVGLVGGQVLCVLWMGGGCFVVVVGDLLRPLKVINEIFICRTACFSLNFHCVVLEQIC